MKKEISKIIEFIQDIYTEQSWAKYAVIGISGGKDSTVVASLCANALGKDRVLGVIMPNKKMTDQDDALRVCKEIGIKHIVIDIGNSVSELVNSLEIGLKGINTALNHQGLINISPRIRMSTLYALANSISGLVANTSNASEALVGYCTKWGVNVGDFAPIVHLTKEEVVSVGLELGISPELILKAPSDGISGLSDEDNMGIKYSEIYDYLKGNHLTQETQDAINQRIIKNKHKSDPIPSLK